MQEMVKLQQSQLAKTAVVALLFLITPLLSTYARSSYLYLLFNVIIVALGVESGLLSVFSKLPNDKKHAVAGISESTSSMDSGTSSSLGRSSESFDNCSKTVEKPTSVGKGSGVAKMHQEKKSQSKQSLFFIGEDDAEEEDVEEEGSKEEDREEEIEVLSSQELFVKAEKFIGKFYEQLKIQREESWRKIHGLYKGPRE